MYDYPCKSCPMAASDYSAFAQIITVKDFAQRL